MHLFHFKHKHLFYIKYYSRPKKNFALLMTTIFYFVRTDDKVTFGYWLN